MPESKIKYCPRCGVAMAATDKYCHNCGYRFTDHSNHQGRQHEDLSQEFSDASEADSMMAGILHELSSETDSLNRLNRGDHERGTDSDHEALNSSVAGSNDDPLMNNHEHQEALFKSSSKSSDREVTSVDRKALSTASRSYSTSTRGSNKSDHNSQAIYHRSNRSRSADHRLTIANHWKSVVGLVVLVVLICLGVKGYSSYRTNGYARPTEPAVCREAKFNRNAIVRNVHRDEPSIKVRRTSVSRNGTVTIKTNLKAPSVTRIKQIWPRIYDKNLNSYGSKVDLRGVHGQTVLRAESNLPDVKSYGSN